MPGNHAPPRPPRSDDYALIWASVYWGLHPATIIDGGAANGGFTAHARSVFPDAKIVMVEPLPARREALAAVVAGSGGRVMHVAAALGETDGSVKLYQTEALDSSYIRPDVHDNTGDTRGVFIDVPVTSLDSIMNKHSLEGPYLLKLDTHGVERDIIMGARNFLTETQMIVVEVYGYKIQPHTRPFWKIAAILDDRGFHLAKILNIVNRQDGTFWQADAVFIRKSNPVTSSVLYDGK